MLWSVLRLRSVLRSSKPKDDEHGRHNGAIYTQEQDNEQARRNPVREPFSERESPQRRFSYHPIGRSERSPGAQGACTTNPPRKA